MVIHHTAALASALTAAALGQGHMYTLLLLSTECTTPFLNARWWLVWPLYPFRIAHPRGRGRETHTHTHTHTERERERERERETRTHTHSERERERGKKRKTEREKERDRERERERERERVRYFCSGTSLWCSRKVDW
jgi:hypothetical protein